MCTYVMIMLFNQLLDMPHLSGGWIISTKEMLNNRDVNKFDKYIFCANGKIIGSFISAHETWDQHFIYIYIYIYIYIFFFQYMLETMLVHRGYCQGDSIVLGFSTVGVMYFFAF
jgi:hypothetical protein